MTEQALPQRSAVPARDAASPPAPAASSTQPLDLPERAVFWTWVWRSIRPVVGWVLVALGALALVLGWYGVSGQALTAKQLPYLVSGGLTGIALIVIAGVFLATEDWRRQLTRLDSLERKVDDLLLLLTTDLPAAELGSLPAPQAAAAVAVETLVALPTGTVFHRPECALVSGKSTARPVDSGIISRRSLAPCRVCDPPRPAG